jgi:hypothetical protein
MQAWYAAVAEFRDLPLGNGLDDMNNQVLMAFMAKVRSLIEVQTGK